MILVYQSWRKLKFAKHKLWTSWLLKLHSEKRKKSDINNSQSTLTRLSCNAQTSSTFYTQNPEKLHSRGKLSTIKKCKNGVCRASTNKPAFLRPQIGFFNFQASHFDQIIYQPPSCLNFLSYQIRSYVKAFGLSLLNSL